MRLTEAQFSAMTGKPAPAPNAEKLSRSKIVAQKFADQCASHRLPPHVRELRFAKSIERQWRFDFAWPALRLAVEIEGLVVYRGWVAKLDGKEPVTRGDRVTNVLEVESRMLVMGRHATIGGFEEDCEKYGEALILGWRVLRFSQNQVLKRVALDMTARAIAASELRMAGKPLPPIEVPPVQSGLDLPPPVRPPPSVCDCPAATCLPGRIPHTAECAAYVGPPF